jgi:hypothetical protein
MDKNFLHDPQKMGAGEHEETRRILFKNIRDLSVLRGYLFFGEEIR